MASTEQTRVRVVVVENGARTLGSELAPECEETIVVRQSTGELPAELACRVIGRIALVERSAASIRRAVILLAPFVDDQSMAARHCIARALLIHAPVLPAALVELRLAVDTAAGLALRHQLLALVEALICDPQSNRAPIRLQFGSGLH